MIPVFLPTVSIVPAVPKGTPSTVRDLCRQAGIECRVTGPSASRRVFLRDTDQVEVSREPGNSGDVSIGLPVGSPHKRAFLALGVLAYAVFDYAARESVRGLSETRPAPPRGRPRAPRPQTNAERQRAWRARQKCRVANT